MNIEDFDEQTQSNIIFDELRGRILFSQLTKVHPDIKFNSHSPIVDLLNWDITFLSGSSTQLLVGDIKVRYCTSDAYSTTICEIPKYDGLRKTAKAMSGTPFFIIIFSDNKIALFNLDSVKKYIGNKRRPDGNDYFGSENQTYTTSDHYLLPIKQAEVYDLPPAPSKYLDYNEWIIKECRKRYPDRSFMHIELGF